LIGAQYSHFLRKKKALREKGFPLEPNGPFNNPDYGAMIRYACPLAPAISGRIP
jgi:hypothetical protein